MTKFDRMVAYENFQDLKAKYNLLESKIEVKREIAIEWQNKGRPQVASLYLKDIEVLEIELKALEKMLVKARKAMPKRK